MAKRPYYNHTTPDDELLFKHYVIIQTCDTPDLNWADTEFKYRCSDRGKIYKEAPFYKKWHELTTDKDKRYYRAIKRAVPNTKEVEQND